MSLTLNMVGGGSGGGLSPTDALLRVQSFAGSTVTITKGAVTKSDLGHENADDSTIYDYYFIIHQSQFDNVNPWTISATTIDGYISTSTIIINLPDEYNVSLFAITLFADTQTGLGNWEAKKWPLNSGYINGTNAATLNVTQNENGSMYIGMTAINGASGGAVYALPIDFSKYSKLYITYQSSVTAAQRTANVSIHSNLTEQYAVTNRISVSELSSTSKATATVDVSSINTNAYIFLFRYRGDGNTGSNFDYVTIYNVTLEH